MKNPYQLITDRVIAKLKTGVVPWRQLWSGQNRIPRNLISQRPYRGINTFTLASDHYESVYWLTFNQAHRLHGTVLRGEVGTPVVYWHWKQRDDEVTGEKIDIPILRHYHVFNLDQCRIPGDRVPLPWTHNRSFNPIQACEQVVSNMPQPPGVFHDSDKAYYAVNPDTIHLPPPTWFETPHAYYSTLFHELVHATGHASRLNRKGITSYEPFGSGTYSREELVAEMGAAFLCGQCNIEQATLDNSASYIASWLRKLENDVRLVVQAGASAQKAADFILGGPAGIAQDHSAVKT